MNVVLRAGCFGKQVGYEQEQAVVGGSFTHPRSGRDGRNRSDSTVKRCHIDQVWWPMPAIPNWEGETEVQACFLLCRV